MKSNNLFSGHLNQIKAIYLKVSIKYSKRSYETRSIWFMS